MKCLDIFVLYVYLRFNVQEKTRCRYEIRALGVYIFHRKYIFTRLTFITCILSYKQVCVYVSGKTIYGTMLHPKRLDGFCWMDSALCYKNYHKLFTI